MLMSRLGSEIADLRAGRWSRTLGLSDQQVKGTGKQDEGQKNKVQELHYVTESGEFSGYFKEDKGFNPTPEHHEKTAGINQTDPNYGARSVASYRIDQLFNAGVTARAEFAVHNGMLGTVLETAKGVPISEVIAKGSAEAKEQPGAKTVDFKDPVLQRSLNKLQLLDVICGQLDRHQGNFRINTDQQGKVTGVTGIDLDMAFGKEHKDVDELKVKAMNYAGMPEVIDAEFGETILRVTEDDIRNALKGLLPAGEIEATCTRLRTVQDIVAQQKSKGQLVDKWDESTINRTRDYAKRWNYDGAGNYMAQVTSSQVKGAHFAIRETLNKWANSNPQLPRSPFRDDIRARLADEPREIRAGFGKAMFGLLIQQGSNLVEGKITDGTIPWQKGVEFAYELMNETLADDSVFARAIVACQEASGVDMDTLSGAIGTVLGPRLTEIYPGVLMRYAVRVLDMSGV